MRKYALIIISTFLAINTQKSFAVKKTVKDDFDRCKIYQVVLNYLDSLFIAQDSDWSKDTIIKGDVRIYSILMTNIGKSYEHDYKYYVPDTIFKNLTFLNNPFCNVATSCTFNTKHKFVLEGEPTLLRKTDRSVAYENKKVIIYKPLSVKFSGLFRTSNRDEVLTFARIYYDIKGYLHFFTFLLERNADEYRIKKVYLRKI